MGGQLWHTHTHIHVYMHGQTEAWMQCPVVNLATRFRHLKTCLSVPIVLHTDNNCLCNSRSACRCHVMYDILHEWPHACMPAHVTYLFWQMLTSLFQLLLSLSLSLSLSLLLFFTKLFQSADKHPTYSYIR